MRSLARRRALLRELYELRAIDRRERQLERVARLGGHEVWRSDESGERGARDAEIVLRGEQRESRVAHLDDGYEGSRRA